MWICCGRSANCFGYGCMFQIVNMLTKCAKKLTCYLRDIFIRKRYRKSSKISYIVLPPSFFLIKSKIKNQIFSKLVVWYRKISVTCRESCFHLVGIQKLINFHGHLKISALASWHQHQHWNRHRHCNDLIFA